MKTTFKPSLISWDVVRGEPSAKTLVLLLHGMDCGPETISAVADKIVAEMPSSYILIPALPFRWHQCVDLKQVSKEILDHLDELDKKVPLKNFASIRIVGHSAGGVLAQSIYLLSHHPKHALGQIESQKIRLILIAPLSRGWTISHHLPLSHKISWKMGMALIPLIKVIEFCRSFVSGRRVDAPWILQLQRGAPFLVWMRLAWLRLIDKPEIFVLLGSIDEIISWRDMVDEVTGSNTVHLQVPWSDHVGIVNFKDAAYGKARADLFAIALATTPAEARNMAESVVPWDVDPKASNPNVKRVVFVIHGIRDEGHWTQKMAARARAFHREAGLESREQIAVITSSYGYFSMLEFLMPSRRMVKIHWLMDHYVEAQRLFPAAKFSFIGHSNGTYLLAQALKLYPDVKFERVAFAGSVVSSRYDWTEVKSQVSYVLNFTATTDWVVALFPRIADVLPLSWLLGPNLGGAGIVPFREGVGLIVASNDYVKGAHSAAIREDNWTDPARFAVQDPPYFPSDNPQEDSKYASAPAWCFNRNIGWATSGLVWLILLGVILFWLPMLAWKNPMFFWLAPVGLALISILSIPCIQAGSQGATLEKKERIKKLSGLSVTDRSCRIVSNRLKCWPYVNLGRTASVQRVWDLWSVA